MRMGGVGSCCREPKDDVLLVTKMDLSHCGCVEVPNVVFNAERCIETLILASNQISSLPPQLFHCQELKHLNLTDNCISNIPTAIGSLIHLVSLKLDKNNLTDLPENLKCCRKLKRLSLNNNQWKQVPNIATQLISLEEMYMNDCELSFLPASVGRLTKLKILELRNNNLCNLPLSMSRLSSLTRLDIGDNEFTKFPACVNSLKSLTELLVDNNDIEEVTDVKNLVNLEHFDASYNHISSISETIGYCTSLSMLNLSFNYLEQLPESIGNIEKLETLHLEMNELTELAKSIGKLKNLEDLNICNNRLCNIPISIGLLRNLRNLNLSRNTIEEFPAEIGSCARLTIINAGYNRLQVLPSEIGYLNNLKVLDLVGNFLMYLPITIINLRNIRAIWLSANQNVPLIPFTEDLNIASGERFLTNIALPQLGEIPFYNNQANSDSKVIVNEKSSWSKKIRFAEDEDLLPGKLHRTPTPFPKELRAPNRKQHARNDGLKGNENYVNLFDGRACDMEMHPPTTPITKDSSGLLNFSESCVTMVREANIRKNNKDSNFEMEKENPNGDQTQNMDTEFLRESNVDYAITSNSGPIKLCAFRSVSKIINDEAQFDQVDVGPNYSDTTKRDIEELTSNVQKSEISSHKTIENGQNEQLLTPDSEKHQSTNNGNCSSEKTIYSNISIVSDDNYGQDNVPQFEFSKVDAQTIREMYHNDIISGRNSNDRPGGGSEKVMLRNGIVKKSQTRPTHLNLQCSGYINPPTQAELYNTDYGRRITTALGHTNSRFENGKLLSRQDMISLTERMRNKNLSPPCYEIAKMYSTKAALFEKNRIENC